MLKLKPLLLLALCGLSIQAFAAAPKAANGMLVDDKGMTLYTFDKDTTPGKSACSGACAAIWPAAMASPSDTASGDLGLMPTADGKQWTYKGHPLYRYASDKKAGDMSGDNFKDVWHTVKP